MLRTREDVRCYIAELSGRSGRDEPSVRRWQAIGRATLLVVLAYSALQYYFFTVLVEILSLPGVTVFTAPLKLGVG